MLESITETQWAAAYAVVSLIIWLGYEMSGMAAEASKNVFDGHFWATIVIPLWLPALGFAVCLLTVLLPIICLGWLLDKSRTIKIK